MSANWAPVHLLAHMLEWQLFGANVAAYHLTNALLHALVSLLLVALLAASRVPRAGAALAGVFFLVHPANVEAVAWISQLKTLLAMALMLGALLLLERRPALATGAFALALLCKALAAVALPVAVALARAHARAAGRDAVPRARRAVLWSWGGVVAAFSGVELAAFLYQHPGGGLADASFGARLGFSAEIGARYLVMAATGIGVSTFHEPAPGASPLDAWVIAGLAAGSVLAARLTVAVRRRKDEAAWWVLAAGSFAPVAQVFPFLYPMADRYLYFILPGLLGGALLAGGEAFARLAPRARRPLGWALAAAAAVGCVHFAAVSHRRAALWVSDARIMADAVRNYPDGSMAHYVRARGAARDRDGARAAAELRLAARNPAFGFQHVRKDPMLSPVRRSPEFQALLRELAREKIELLRAAERLTETDLISLAQAQLVVGDADGALQTLERASALDGRFRGVIVALRREARALRRAGAGAGEPTGSGAGEAAGAPSSAQAPPGSAP
jgi:hypothetical protein